jgi:hypothetical protein
VTVVKMKKTINSPRKKNEKEREKDCHNFFNASVHMEHVAREFAHHIEDFGMDFLASEWAKFHEAQGKLSQSIDRLKQDKVSSGCEEGVTDQSVYDNDDDE